MASVQLPFARTFRDALEHHVRRPDAKTRTYRALAQQAGVAHATRLSEQLSWRCVPATEVNLKRWTTVAKLIGFPPLKVFRPKPGGADTDQVLRPRAVAECLGISRTTLWRMRRRGEFPAPIQITLAVVGWRRSTVERWLAERQEAA